MSSFRTPRHLRTRLGPLEHNESREAHGRLAAGSRAHADIDVGDEPGGDGPARVAVPAGPGGDGRPNFRTKATQVLTSLAVAASSLGAGRQQAGEPDQAHAPGTHPERTHRPHTT